MQQTITINIVDPAVPNTPGADETLPQLGDTITSLLTQHPLLFAIIGIVIVVATIALFSRAILRKRSVVAGLRGGGITSHKKFFIVPLLLLAPLALLSLNSPAPHSYAAVTASASDQTVNISQGDTSATFSVSVYVDSTTYADGYNIDAKIDQGASTIPTGVALDYGSDTLNDTTEVEVRKYRSATNPTDDGQIEYTIAIPADAPLGDGYVIITLDYTIDNFMENLANKKTIMNNALAGSLVNMQQLTSAICANTAYDATKDGNNANNTITLTDTRNNQDYRVRMLADNKCWMIDNLKLGGTGSTITLNSTNSDMASGTFTIPAAPTATYSGGLVYNNANGDRSNCSITYYSNNYLTCNGANDPTAGSYTNTNYVGYADPSGTANCTNNTSSGNFPNAYNTSSLTQCGYLYNWYTATAGTGTYADASGSKTNSICPAGWKLPTGAPYVGQFALLDIAYSGNGGSQASQPNFPTTAPWFQSAAFQGAFSGYYDRVFYDQGAYARYWSATAYSVTESYSLYFNLSTINPGSLIYRKSSGAAVRCVLG